MSSDATPTNLSCYNYLPISNGLKVMSSWVIVMHSNIITFIISVILLSTSMTFFMLISLAFSFLMILSFLLQNSIFITMVIFYTWSLSKIETFYDLSFENSIFQPPLSVLLSLFPHYLNFNNHPSQQSFNPTIFSWSSPISSLYSSPYLAQTDHWPF